jgi:hypothetical protein
MYWVRARVKDSEKGRLVRFCSAFSRSICDKNWRIIRCVESDSFWSYVGSMHESWEDNISEEEQWAKISIGRSSCIEKHRWQQNWIFILKTLFPQKLSDVSLTNPTSTVGLQLLDLWLLKVMLRYINEGITTIKPGHQITGNACVVWSDESSSRCSLHQEKFMIGEHPRKPTIRNAWFQKWNTKEVLWWFGQQYRGTVFCWPYYYPSWPNYCKGVCEQVG